MPPAIVWMHLHLRRRHVARGSKPPPQHIPSIGCFGRWAKHQVMVHRLRDALSWSLHDGHQDVSSRSNKCALPYSCAPHPAHFTVTGTASQTMRRNRAVHSSNRGATPLACAQNKAWSPCNPRLRAAMFNQKQMYKVGRGATSHCTAPHCKAESSAAAAVSPASCGGGKEQAPCTSHKTW